MKIGTVMSNLCPRVLAPCLEGHQFALVRTPEGLLAALNPVGAQAGDGVMVTQGAAAGKLCMDAPVDAVVAAILCGEEKSANSPKND